MAKDISYPVHKGHLVKSPPDTRLTGKMKSWRRRLFVLREDKSLEYYDDKGGEKRLLKTINLSLCTCLDANLSHKRFANVFSIKIKGKQSGKDVDRTYYLAADSPYEMNLWIDQICKICDFQQTQKGLTGPAMLASSEHCPVASSGKVNNGGTRDSGIHVSPSDNSNTSDLVHVSPPVSTYGDVPLPRPAADNEKLEFNTPPYQSQSNYVPHHQNQSNYDTPPHQDQSNYNPSHQDELNYDIPPYQDQPDYDYPPQQGQPDYDYPPHQDQPDYDVPPRQDQAKYDIPPHQDQSNYDTVPPPVMISPYKQPAIKSTSCPLDMSSSTESGFSSCHKRSSNESDYSDYDIPPCTQPSLYDDVPSPVLKYQQNNNLISYTNESRPSTYVKQAYPTQKTLPPVTAMAKMDIGDQRQSRQFPSHYQSPNSFNYDSVPPPQSATLSCDRISQTYDYVPPPKASSSQVGPSGVYDQVPMHADNTDNQSGDIYDKPPPPIPQAPKPLGKAYVNLTFPVIEPSGYNKPLPIPPDISDELRRDSGTVADFGSEDVYDVPPVRPSTPPVAPKSRHGPPAPIVDRSSKPGHHSPPAVNRSCKPESGRSGDYVNLPNRSLTLRDFDRQPRKTATVQRSKSSAADAQSESGYLYMDSPKRTESSLRFSKKRRSSLDTSVEEDNEDSYEYMQPQRSGGSDPYQNFDPQDLQQSKQGADTSEKRLKGHYQDIDVVCYREAPFVPERHKTNYTTIDLEKTRGFRKTCEDVGKGQ